MLNALALVLLALVALWALCALLLAAGLLAWARSGTSADLAKAEQQLAESDALLAQAQALQARANAGRSQPLRSI